VREKLQEQDKAIPRTEIILQKRTKNILYHRDQNLIAFDAHRQ
jgi:hypothetical protein